MDNQEPLVTLIDENGEEFEFVVLDTFFVDDNEYAVLAPLEEEGEEEAEESEEEAVVLRIEDDDEGNQVLVPVEEEEEWQKIADAWEKRNQEQDEAD